MYSFISSDAQNKVLEKFGSGYYCMQPAMCVDDTEVADVKGNDQTGMITGIVFGVLFLLYVSMCCTYYICRKRM